MVVLTAATTTAHVHGLYNNSDFNCCKLFVTSPCVCTPATSKKKQVGGMVVAKYGEKNIYFDLEDISNTIRAWDLYRSDTPSPYNPLQRKLFKTFAKLFTNRGFLLNFLLLVGGGALAYAGANATNNCYKKTTTAAHIHGLSSSSIGFNSRKLSVTHPHMCMFATSKRVGGVVVAKYGEKRIYFDLKDINNTTGAWDLYGSNTPSPYNPLQRKFFKTFVKLFTKRGFFLKFLLLVGGGALAYAGANATGDTLPIVRGPQKPPTLGPKGKI